MIKKHENGILHCVCDNCKEECVYDITNFPWHCKSDGELSNIMVFCDNCKAVTGYNMNLTEAHTETCKILLELRKKVVNGVG